MAFKRNRLTSWLNRKATTRRLRRVGTFESLENRRNLAVETSFLDISPASSAPLDAYSSSIGLFFSAVHPTMVANSTSAMELPRAHAWFATSNQAPGRRSRRPLWN